MIWRMLILITLVLCVMAATKALAADCPGNPNALGTSRVIALDPRELPRIGTVQYSTSLPLEDKEVVLTFDDGPMPPYTNRVLDVLAEHCVRANYFIIGRMARGYPDLIKRIHADGHLIGNHSQNHPLAFERMPLHAVQDEVEHGFASLHAALGDRNAVAPFFRIPGLLRAKEVEGYLQSRGLVTWSADVVADDWKHINAFEVVRRAISRLDEKGKGILLLHDIQPATALALPELLRQLKAKGYRIVQVVPGKVAAPPVASTSITPAHVVAPPPIAISVVNSEGTLPQRHRRAEDNNAEAPAQRPALPVAVADSLARSDDDIPKDPVRPLTSGSKPARNMPSPGKFVTTEPGGWPLVVSVPVTSAGSIGVSSVAQQNQASDGRFQ